MEVGAATGIALTDNPAGTPTRNTDLKPRH
jgi:hypothetical protein